MQKPSALRERLRLLDRRSAPLLLPLPSAAYFVVVPVAIFLIVVALVQGIWLMVPLIVIFTAPAIAIGVSKRQHPDRWDR